MSRKPRVRFKKKVIPPTPAVPGFRAQYDAASTGRRAKNWENATGDGPVTALARDHDTIRKRCRHEFQNNPYGGRVGDVVSGATVGEGIKPNFRKLGEEAEQIKGWWDQWSEQLDADGVSDFTACKTSRCERSSRPARFSCGSVAGLFPATPTT